MFWVLLLLACEFMDMGSMDASKRNLGLSNPLDQDYPMFVLVETQGSNEKYGLHTHRFLTSTHFLLLVLPAN